MTDRPIEFPPDFVFGSAAAAHQVEGENRRNDWWAHEQASDTNAAEPSGVACDHYHRFAEDFRLLRALAHPAHRLSIEWSRIEPEEGQVDAREVNHYRQVFDTLRDLGITPWVTLHHFTSPQWFTRRGGFARAENLPAFERFVTLVVKTYGNLVDHWCTINEPNVVAELGYRYGYFPPRRREPAVAADVLLNSFRAHAAAAAIIRGATRSGVDVGITLAVQAHEPLNPASADDQAFARQRDAETNGVMFDALRDGVFRYPGRAPEAIAGLREASTFVGVQYYSRVRYDAASGGPALPDMTRTVTQMGWEVYPEGFAPLLRRAAATGLPVYVTENGVCTDDDRIRVRYIADHLAAVDAVRRVGVDVRGYFYWSAMDNFEWNFGYGPTFGLIAVDRTTLERVPRPSARFFADIIRERRLTPALVERWTAPA